MNHVAQTIVDQIKTIDRRAFWAWGSKDFVCTQHGLQFRVGGMTKFKGLVHIKYNAGSDLYDIDFLKIRKGLAEVVKSEEGVYAEDLVGTLDSTIQ